MTVLSEEQRAEVSFDHFEEPFSAVQLADLDLAYSMNRHRTQESKAERVIVVLYKSRVLDPSWTYMAVTPAEEQVIMIGDTAILRACLQRPWAANRQRVGLVWPGTGYKSGDMHYGSA